MTRPYGLPGFRMLVHQLGAIFDVRKEKGHCAGGLGGPMASLGVCQLWHTKSFLEIEVYEKVAKLPDWVIAPGNVD
jgi:hypothetical protein